MSPKLAVLRLSDDGAALQAIGGRPRVAWIMRELQRFGVERFILLGEMAEPASLARFLPKPTEIMVATAVESAEPYLLADGATLFDLNLASGDCLPLPKSIIPPAPEAAILAQLHRPALFLDRDGVINVNHGYVGTRERFEFVPGALALIRRATSRGWHVFIVTNQAGVARGFYDEAAVRDLLGFVADEARAAGGTIDDWRYCPHHPDAMIEAYRRACPWRKPGPGMLLDLIRAWELDPAHCLMIGDQPSDLAAAQAAGVAGHLFGGGDLDSFAVDLIQT